MVKVSIIITAHNYGQYLAQCIESALRQNYDSFEVIVADDGSTDNTVEVLQRYEGRIRVIRLPGVGLARACNAAILASQGDYIVRFDADDFFDENLLLVEANVLDRSPNIHLVYPDYYRVNVHGQILELVRLPRVYEEVRLLDRNPLAIGSMYRREAYEAIGGYDESLTQQEDYDFWSRFVERFRVYNVNLPLMYYRQHEKSMSKNQAGRLASRRIVKEKYIQAKGGIQEKGIVGIIPAMNRLIGGQKLPLRRLNGKSALEYLVNELQQVTLLDRIIVSTEDEEIADAAKSLGVEVPFLRPSRLARSSVAVEAVVQHLLQSLELEEQYRPGIVLVAHVHSPFLRMRHIQEAINTMVMYNTDSVISVTKDLTYHWKSGLDGLEPVGSAKRLLKEEKDAIYKENGALYLTRREIALRQQFIGERVGHIEMLDYESIRLDTDHDVWVAEQMLASGDYA